MSKRPINYTSRDFESIKNDLVNYAKRYYPTTFKDFNEASFGSLVLDMVSYVGDQLSFYTDYQANESFLDSAIEFSNISRLAQQLGYKQPGAATSTGICSFYVTVPANATSRGPDLAYFPILQRGTILTSNGGSSFTLIENVDFAKSSNEVTVATVDSTTGVPLSFAVKAYGQIISGKQFQTSVQIGNYQRFRRVPVGASNISEILSVKDSQGNEYYEVNYLTEDVVYKEQANFNSDMNATPYVLTTTPVPRRFTVEHDVAGNTTLQFGYGSADNLTGDLIADPSDVILRTTGRKYIADETFDPSDLITSDKFGVVPVSTTLTIDYAANDVDNVNAPVNTVVTVTFPRFTFKNQGNLDATQVALVEDSLEVDNENPILGDTSTLTADEIRTRAYATFATQNRAVTRNDYINLCYRMPAKFGKLKRVNVIQDPGSYKRNLNLYTLCENISGNFTTPNDTLRNNLKVWLNRYRMVNDTIDILDGKIINLGINFEILADLDVNRYKVLQDCVEYLKNNYLNTKRNIGEAIYISEIYKLLNDVPGVTDTIHVEFENKSGGVYSDYVFDVRSNLSDDGRYIIIPSDSVGEILLPDVDLKGVVK
jgi:hypothetical protein